ncbi:MAG: hypothetical protein ACK6BN_04320 [Pseudanabaena sp.]|jgi:hypothetical protein
MRNIQKAIQPIYQCEQSQPITLYEGEIEFLDDSKAYQGYGEIAFNWLPDIKVKFSFQDSSFRSLDFTNDISLRLLIPEISRTKISSKVRIPAYSLGSINIVSDHIPNCELGDGSKLSFVIFHLTNFVDYKGDYVETNYETASPIRLVLESYEWRVTIDYIKNKDVDIMYTLRSNGGYAITHCGRLERIDGYDFHSQEAEKVLVALNYFLSFVAGTWVSPILPVGFSATGQRVWEKWLHYRTTTYNPKFSWFPEKDIEHISVAFAGFMKWWNDEDWQESFKFLIYYYVESNNSGVEEGILMTQSACELLTWLVLVQERKVISDDGLDKLKAEDSLRLLFSWLQIPITMPPVPEKSPLVLDALQKMLKAESNLLDCAGCITAIRNRITHPKRKGKSRTILKYSSEERAEAYILSKWYLELCLLRLFGYDGVYTNRLYKLSWEGYYDKVPWAS